MPRSNTQLDRSHVEALVLAVNALITQRETWWRERGHSEAWSRGRAEEECREACEAVQWLVADLPHRHPLRYAASPLWPTT
jgi:hypothetical protein